MAKLPATLSRRAARRLAIGLLAFGATGILLLAVLAIALEGALGELELVDATAGPLGQASNTIGDTANAFAGFGTSLANAEQTAKSAATTSRNAAATAARLADGMSISVFGAQPFLQLAQDFRQQATDLSAMAGDLDTLASALRTNEGDVATIQADLTDLHARLGTSGIALPLGVLRLLVALVLLWLSVPAFGSLALGSWLVRAGEHGAPDAPHDATGTAVSAR